MAIGTRPSLKDFAERIGIPSASKLRKDDERLHGCGAERHKRAGDQGLDNVEGAGCAEGLSIVEEVPVVESEAIRA
jgi:hypothetical protein